MIIRMDVPKILKRSSLAKDREVEKFFPTMNSRFTQRSTQDFKSFTQISK